MKKLLICILCLVSLKGFSQLRFGIQGSFSALTYWQNNGYAGLDAREFTMAVNGWQAGAFAEYDLGYSGLVLQPALMYAFTGAHLGQSLGFDQQGPDVTGYADTHLKINTLRLPVNLLYTYRLDSKWKVFGGLGPYIGYNLSGTETGYYLYSNESTSNYTPGKALIKNTLHISNGVSYNTIGRSNIAPLDAGVNIMVGGQFKRVQFSVNYMRGFITQYHTYYVNMGNQDWNFTLGYVLFGHERKPKL
jgi:hypothetical protein